jgi:YidC/Oxa1 family membrane protein insertase
MEKRAILAIGLSVLVFILFQFYQQKHTGRPGLTRPATQTSSPNREAPAQIRPEPAAPAITVPSGAETKANSQKLVVASELYRGVVDNEGAVLTSWQLKKYKSSQGGIFEMITANRGFGLTYPGSLIFKDSKLTDLANKEFYDTTVNGASAPETNISAPATIVMKLRRGDLEIEKRFVFDKDNYLVDLSVTAVKGDKPLECQFFLGQDIGPEQEHLASSAQLEAVYYLGGKVKRESPPKDEKQVKRIEGDIRWVGLDMQYFSEIAIPSSPLPYYEIQRLPAKTVGLDGKDVDRNLLRLTTPVDGSLQYKIYLGPKKQSNLAAVKAADISGVINYGMFTIIVMPLLTFLRWIYQYVHNYGYSIIILTLVLSLLLFPFRLKQMLSMKKMQVVQPKVKAIQDKYRRYKKTDPKRAEMNQEVMALYKEHGVNPLGGCLPMVLQMPLLFAFYSLLQYSIELRQAPFIGYIHDLSVKDPYYVLPIIMGVTMFISQKMTPMTPGADPTASKMMTIMPAVFTLMFLNVSSGLNLYFLCSNIFQIAFQKIAERWTGGGKSGDKSKS